MKDDYVINTETLAILPIDEKNTIIMKCNEELNIYYSPKKIIEYSCEYFGSSYEGRVKGSCRILGNNRIKAHKVPIVISEQSETIFFPTTSPERNDCIWLNYKSIASFKENCKNSTLIEFKNGKKLLIPISIFSLSNQYLRSSQLSAIISSRKIKNSSF